PRRRSPSPAARRPGSPRRRPSDPSPRTRGAPSAPHRPSLPVATTARNPQDGHPAAAHAAALTEEQLVRGNLSFHDITDLVAGHTEKRTPLGWFMAFSVALLGLMVLGLALAYLVWNGTGVWGL